MFLYEPYVSVERHVPVEARRVLALLELKLTDDCELPRGSGNQT